MRNEYDDPTDVMVVKIYLFNRDIVRRILPDVHFHYPDPDSRYTDYETHGTTCTFRCDSDTFLRLHLTLKRQGYYPESFMRWYALHYN